MLLKSSTKRNETSSRAQLCSQRGSEFKRYTKASYSPDTQHRLKINQQTYQGLALNRKIEIVWSERLANPTQWTSQWR
jgi:hypothetical protein